MLPVSKTYSTDVTDVSEKKIFSAFKRLIKHTFYDWPAFTVNNSYFSALCVLRGFVSLSK